MMSELPGFSHILAGVVCPSAGGQTVLGTPRRVMEVGSCCRAALPVDGRPSRSECDAKCDARLSGN